MFKTKINESQEALENLQLQYDGLNESFQVVTDEAKDATEKLVTMTGEFERVSLENTELKTQVETMTSEAANLVKEMVDFDEKVGASVATELAKMNHAPLEIMDDEEESLDVKSSLKSLKGKELVNFYNEHKSEIFKALKA